VLEKEEPPAAMQAGLGPAEKALGVSEGSVLNRSQRPPLPAEEVDSILGCCGEGIISLYPALVSLYSDTASGFGPPSTREIWTNWCKFSREAEDGWRLEHWPCEVRLRELLLLFSLTLSLLDQGESHSQKPSSSPVTSQRHLFPSPSLLWPQQCNSGSTSLSFQGPPGHCHLICHLLARCWQ